MTRADYQCLKCDHRWSAMVAGGVMDGHGNLHDRFAGGGKVIKVEHPEGRQQKAPGRIQKLFTGRDANPCKGKKP